MGGKLYKHRKWTNLQKKKTERIRDPEGTKMM